MKLDIYYDVGQKFVTLGTQKDEKKNMENIPIYAFSTSFSNESLKGYQKATISLF